MKFLSTLLLFGGYVLVYAAVANKGKLVYHPWLGIFHDAYGVDSPPAQGAAAATGSGLETPQAPPAPRPRGGTANLGPGFRRYPGPGR